MSDVTKEINPRCCTDKVHVNYAHVGLYDAPNRRIWLARKRFGVTPVRVSHASLLRGGTQDTSTADKDRFVCFWFHTPGSGHGYVHGYPIEWDEGHLLIRLDPNWDYLNRKFIANADSARVQRNIDQQFDWGRKIFEAYLEAKPKFPLSWHMIGPRPADSMFYIQRVDAQA